MKTILPLIGLALLLFILPNATADDTSTAVIFLDVWEIGSNTYINITTRAYTGTGSTFTLEVWGRNAGSGASTTWLVGPNQAMTLLENGASWYYYNTSIATTYDNYAVIIAYNTGGLQDHVHRASQTFRGSDFLRPNPEDDAAVTHGFVTNEYANATFEGQSHANATWCPIVNCVSTIEGEEFVTEAEGNAWYEGQLHANATWESQQHANVTWESQSHANESWESQPHANMTWESQRHANETWCALPCDGGTPGQDNYVDDDWFNNTFRLDATFGKITLMSGEVLGSAIPSSMAIPGMIVFVMVLGIAIGFVSKTNPMPSLAGAFVELVALGLWYTQEDGIFTFGTTDMKHAFGLLIIGSFIAMSFRTYLMMNPQNRDVI